MARSKLSSRRGTATRAILLASIFLVGALPARAEGPVTTIEVVFAGDAEIYQDFYLSPLNCCQPTSFHFNFTTAGNTTGPGACTAIWGAANSADGPAGVSNCSINASGWVEQVPLVGGGPTCGLNGGRFTGALAIDPGLFPGRVVNFAAGWSAGGMGSAFPGLGDAYSYTSTDGLQTGPVSMLVAAPRIWGAQPHEWLCGGLVSPSGRKFHWTGVATIVLAG